MPLIATTAPALSADTAIRSESSVPAAISPPSGSSTRSVGPQSWQAMGWAWKRRSCGSPYSRRHASHSGNRARVVAGRS
jgi:hypothetical protein